MSFLFSRVLSLKVCVLEGNALRYAASYVVHHVFKGVKKSSHELKRDVTDCLMQLVLGKQEDCEQGTAEEWTNLLDRGGLWHVRETTFQVFNALEEGVRQFLSELSSPAAATGLKAKFVAKLVTNDDVQFHWSIATASFDIDDTEVHETVLRKITELYITIRGFAYASAWIEQYKQTPKNQHSGQRVCVNNFILIKTHSTSIRPDKLDLLFLISHFLDLGAGGRLLFITSLFNLISDFLCRRRFRDRSAVLSTKLGSTLLRKPIAMVSLRRQRTSRRQRASHLHLLVNGDVYGSRIP